jgi:hypothetical protein
MVHSATIIRINITRVGVNKRSEVRPADGTGAVCVPQRRVYIYICVYVCIISCVRCTPCDLPGRIKRARDIFESKI